MAEYLFEDMARIPVEVEYASEFRYRNPIINEDDFVIEQQGIKYLIDAMSMQYLQGASVDYKEDIQGSQFVISNPNAQSTCGCGSSFSV